MDNKGLIFIPDISGFTRFINETEIEHSRFIIEELLELLISSNEIGLEISEIEGDAILFYKYGQPPDLPTLYKQVEKMFCDFHRHLIDYDIRRICQCTACKSAADLTLKVVTHYGEFTDYNVRNFRKLIGKDIIVAHQLLKNDIEHHEYWLVTEGLAQNADLDALPIWVNWNNSFKQTEAGQVGYQYTQLTQLKNEIPPAEPLRLEIPNKVKLITLTKVFDTDINTLLFATVNLNLRGQWQTGVKSTDQVSHILPQVGTKHRCILEKGQLIMYTSSFSYDPDKIVYSETDDKKKAGIYSTFEKLEENKTRLTVEFLS